MDADDRLAGHAAVHLPVQWLLPLLGWRPLFWILAALILLSMAAITWVTPAWPVYVAPTVVAARTALPPEGAELARGGPSLRSVVPTPTNSPNGQDSNSSAEIWQSRYFGKMLPLAIFNHGGMVAMQTL